MSSIKPSRNRKIYPIFQIQKKKKKIVFVFLSCHHKISQAYYLKDRKLLFRHSRGQKSKVKAPKNSVSGETWVADSPFLAVSLPGFSSMDACRN